MLSFKKFRCYQNYRVNGKDPGEYMKCDFFYLFEMEEFYYSAKL